MDKLLRAMAVLGMDFSQINVMTVTALPGMPVTIKDVKVVLRVF